MSGQRRETWLVKLLVDGRQIEREVTIDPPHFIKCADAEVKAIKSELGRGGKEVRALHSRFVREEQS